MKKTMMLMLAVITAMSSLKAQDTLVCPGLSAQISYSAGTVMTSFDSQPIRSINIQYGWDEAKPSSTGAYDFAALDSVLYGYQRKGVAVMLQSNTGQNSPLWALTAAGTFTSSSGPEPGPYPYYYNPAYQTLVWAHFDSIIRHISLLPTLVRNNVIGLFGGYGSTGDLGPNKGTPVGYSYGGETTISVNDAAWIAYRHKFEDSIYHKIVRYIPSGTLRIMMNVGNDREEYAWARGNLPRVIIKEGSISHSVGFNEEYTVGNTDYDYYVRTGKSPDSVFSRGEMQGYACAAIHPNKENRLQMIFMLTMGLNMPNIVNAYVSNHDVGQSVASSYPAEIFNSMSGVANQLRRGISYPHRIPDFKDTVRFPTLQFGVVVDPAQLGAYNSAVATITANTADSAEYKKYLLARQPTNKINPARVLAIRAAYPQLSYSENENDSTYFDDFGFGLRGNYELNLRQVDTARILARIGPDTSFYGRFANQMPPSGQVRYDVSSKLKKGLYTDSMRLIVHYYDTSNYVMTINIPRCDKVVKTITNTNTHQWKTLVFTLPKFKNYTAGHDFYFKSASPYIWEAVTVDRLN